MVHLNLTAVSPSRIPCAELPFCVAFVVHVEGIHKEQGSKPCHYTQRTGAEFCDPSEPSCSMGKISFRCQDPGRSMFFLMPAKQGAQHIFLKIIFLFLLHFSFSITS